MQNRNESLPDMIDRADHGDLGAMKSVLWWIRGNHLDEDGEDP